MSFSWQCDKNLTIVNSFVKLLVTISYYVYIFYILPNLSIGQVIDYRITKKSIILTPRSFNYVRKSWHLIILFWQDAIIQKWIIITRSIAAKVKDIHFRKWTSKTNIEGAAVKFVKKLFNVLCNRFFCVMYFFNVSYRNVCIILV